MTIRDKKKFMDALWDWGFLDDCFSHGIRVSDIDGAVERNGHVLFIEGKPGTKNISTGQRVMFDQLSASGFSVLVVWGKPNEPEALQIWKPYDGRPGLKVSADLERVHETVRLWFVCVNQIPHKSVLDKVRRWPLLLNITPNGDA